MSLGVLTTLFTKIHSVAANIIDPSGVGSSFGMVWNWLWTWVWQGICTAIYGLVKWLLAFVDFMQYFVQKLIGLDYWLNRSRYTLEGAIESDLIFGFLYNDTVQKVFRAMVAIFFVLLIIITIYAIIKSEWEHIAGKGGKFGDGVGNSKTKIFKNSIKAIALVLIFPTILMVGVISANAILASLIKALNIDTSSTLGGQLFQIGSQTANKYEIYAHGEEGRNAVSDQVVFYVYNHNGKDKYLSLSSVGTSTDTVYNVKTYEQYLELAAKSTRYVVNSVFTKLDCGYDISIGEGGVRNFYGYVAKLTDEPFFIAAMVNPNAAAGEVNSKQAMYHYLHNVLQVPIVTPNKSYGFVETKEIKDAAQFNNDGYISNLDLSDFYNNKKGYDMVSACYNTWNYASVYAKTFAFENSVNYSVVRSGTRLPVKFHDADSDGTVDANEKVVVGGSLDSSLSDYTVYDAASGGQVNPSLLQALNLGQVTSAKVLYNSDYVAPYFDGGQKDGIVQLQSEYLVMAEVINFINQNNFRLHILDITSDLIDWSGEGDHVIEDRWISMDGDKPRYIDIADGKTSDSANTNTKKTIPFIVSYSDQCNDTEMGNVLYTGARVANGNELNGAKYIMCIKVEGRNNAKYIPLVHNRTYTDPTTGMMYNFRSDYYNGNYHGVVLAKGLLDSVSLTNAERGEPTYFKSGSDKMYGKDEPYYFDMEVVGAFNQFGATNALITNEEFHVESLSIGYATESYNYDARIKQVPKTGGAEGETEASSKYEYQIFKVQNGEDIEESEREQVITPSIDIIQNLRIKLISDDGTVTASYAGQTTGNNYLYSFTAGDGKAFYFIVQVDSSTQTLNILTYNSGDTKWEIGTRDAKISVQTKTYKILYDYTTVDTDDTDEKQESIINDATPNYFEYVKQIKDPTTEGSEVKSVYTTVDMFTLKEHELTCYFNITFNTTSDTIVKLSETDGVPTITFAEMHATTLGADNVADRGNDYYVQRSQSVRFNLYDFYTADVGGHMNADEYVPGDLKSYDATKESVADRITDTPEIDYDDKKNEDRFFYAKLDSTGFEFHYKDSYLHLYDGKKYVATIYKVASNDPDDSIDDIKELRYRTTYVYIDGNTYYNIRTQNSYADTTAMNTYYEQVQNSVSIQCVRAARGYTFLEADVACVSVIPWHWRWKWSICITTMADREESNYEFYLKDGIQFDYFFEGNNKLHTFYVPSEISYWIIVIASVLMIKVLGTAIWGVIKRIYEITLYFIAAPAVASTIPLDDGTRFDTSIIKPLIGKVFSTYGTMLGINVFFILLYPVKSLSQIFTAEDIATSNSYFLKNFMKGIGNYAWRANLLNLYVYILFVLVAFTMISAIPETISKMVGDGSDIGKMGAETKNAAVGKDGVLKQGMDFISGKSAMEKGKAAIDYVKETPIGKATGAVWNKIKQARDSVGSEDSGGDTGGKPPVENKKTDDGEEVDPKEAEIMQDIDNKIAEKGGIKGSNGETYNTYEEAMASGDEEAMKQAQEIRGEVEAEIMAGDDEEKKKALENMKKREAGETGEETEEEKTDNAEDAAKETFTESVENVAGEMGGDAGKMKGNLVRNLAGAGNAVAGKIAGMVLGKRNGGVQAAIFGDDEAGKQRKKDAILSTLNADQKAEYEQAVKDGKEDEFLSQFEATAKVGDDGQVQMAVKRVKDAAGNAIAEGDQQEVAVGAETANQMIGAVAQSITDDEVKEAVDGVTDPEEKAALEKGLATAATENLAAAMSGDVENDSITEQVVRDVMERPEDEKNGKVIDQAIFEMLQADPEALKSFKKLSGLSAEQMKDPAQVMAAISKLRDGKGGIDQLGITPDHYKKFLPSAVQKAVQSGDYKLDAWELFNRNDPKKAKEYIEAESAKKLQRSNEEAEYEAEKSKEVANGATPEQLLRVLAASGNADPEKVAQMFDKFAGLDNMSPDQQKAILAEINKIDPNLVANLKRSGKAETDLDVIKAYQAAMLLDGSADANNITALLEQSKNNPQAFANDILNGMLEHSDKGDMAGVLGMMGGENTIFTEDEINGLKDQYAANGYMGLSKDEKDKLEAMGISADEAQNMSAFEIQGLLAGKSRREIFDQIREENKTERLVRDLGKNADVSTKDLIEAAGKSEEAKKEIVDAASQRTRVTTKEDEAEAEKAADKAALEKGLLDKKREELKAAGKDEKEIEAELANYKTELAGKDEAELYAMYTGQDKADVDAKLNEEVDAQTMAHLRDNYSKNKAFKSVRDAWFADPKNAAAIAGKSEDEQERMFYEALSKDQGMLQAIGFKGDMGELQAGFRKDALRSMAIDNIDGYADTVREEKDAMLEAKNIERIAQGYSDYAFAVSEALSKDPAIMKLAEEEYRKQHPSDEEGHVDFDDLDEFSKASFMLANFADKLPQDELDRLKKMHVDENATKGKSAEEIRQTAFERITENPEKFRAVYDFMATVDASEGANKVAQDLKDGIIRDQIKEYQKQGIEISKIIDPDTMDPEERKKYEHRQSVLQAELRGNPEIIANLFKNHTTLGQDKMVADIAAMMKGADGKAIDITTLAGKVELLKNNKDFMARYEAALADPANKGKNKYDILKEMANNATIEDLKGGLDNSKIVDYMSTHEKEKNDLVALGAQDIMTALDKDSQDMKKVDAVLSSTYLRNQVSDDVLKTKLGENVDKDVIKELIKQMLKAEGREDQANDDYIEKHMSELKTELALHDITKVIKDKDGNVTGAELGGRNTDAFIASMQKLEKENGTFATNLNRDVTRIIDPANYDPETSSQQFFEIRTVDEFRAREDTPIRNMGDAIDAYNKKGFKWFSKKTRLASSGADDDGTTTGTTDNAGTPKSEVKRHMKYDGTARTAENFDIYEKAKNDQTVIDALKAEGKEVNYDNVHEYLAKNKDKQQELQGQVYAEALIKEAKATGMSAEKFKEKYGVDYNEDAAALGKAIQESETAQKAASKLEAKGDKDFAKRMLADPEAQKQMKREMVSDTDLVDAYEARNGEINIDEAAMIEAARNDEFVKARLGENASEEQIKEFLADKKNSKHVARINAAAKANFVKKDAGYDGLVNGILYEQGKLQAADISDAEIVAYAQGDADLVAKMQSAGINVRDKKAVLQFMNENQNERKAAIQLINEGRANDGSMTGTITEAAFNKHYDKRHGAKDKRFKAAEALRESGQAERDKEGEKIGKALDAERKAEEDESKVLLKKGKFAEKTVENIKLFNALEADEHKKNQVMNALAAQGKEYNYDNVMQYLATRDDGKGGVSEGWNIRKSLKNSVRIEQARTTLGDKLKHEDGSDFSDAEVEAYLEDKKNKKDARKVDAALSSTNKESVAAEVRKNESLVAEAFTNSVTDKELKDYMKKNPNAVAAVGDDDADYIVAIQNDEFLKARFGGEINSGNIDAVKAFLADSKNASHANRIKEGVQLTRARNDANVTKAIREEKFAKKVNKNVTDADIAEYAKNKKLSNPNLVYEAATKDSTVVSIMQSAGVDVNDAAAVKKFLDENEDIKSDLEQRIKVQAVKNELAANGGVAPAELARIRDARVAKETAAAEDGVIDSYFASKKKNSTERKRVRVAEKQREAAEKLSNKGVKALNKEARKERRAENREARKERRAERIAKREVHANARFSGYSDKNVENIEMFKALDADDAMKAEVEAELKAQGKEYNYQNVMKYLSDTKNAKAWDTRKKLNTKVKNDAAAKLGFDKSYEELSGEDRKKVDAHLKSKDKEVVGAAIKGTSLETEAMKDIVTDDDIAEYLDKSGRQIQTTEADRIAAAQKDAKIRARLGADINDEKKVREFLMLNADEAARMDKQAKINNARKDVTAMKAATDMKFKKQISGKDALKYAEKNNVQVNQSEMMAEAIKMTGYQAGSEELANWLKDEANVKMATDSAKMTKVMADEKAVAELTAQKQNEAVNKYYDKKQYKTHKKASGETMAKFQGTILRMRDNRGRTAMERLQAKETHVNTRRGKHAQGNVGNIRLFNELDSDEALRKEIELQLQNSGKEYNYDNVMEYLSKEGNAEIRGKLARKVRLDEAKSVLANDAEYQAVVAQATSEEERDRLTEQYLAKNKKARNKVSDNLNSTDKKKVAAEVKKNTHLVEETKNAAVADDDLAEYLSTNKVKVDVSDADVRKAARGDAYIMGRLKKNQKVTNADVVAEARKNTALMGRVAETKTVTNTEIRNTVRDNKEYLTKLGLSANASSAEIDAALNKTENRKIRESIERDIKISKVTDEDINQHFSTHEAERANFEEQARQNKKVSDADIDAYLKANSGDREKLETKARVEKARANDSIMRGYHAQRFSDNDILDQMKNTGKTYDVSDADIEKAAMGQEDVVKQMNQFLNSSAKMKKRYGATTVAGIKDPKMRAEFMKNFFGQNPDVKTNLTEIAQIAKARQDSAFMDELANSSVSDADITKFMSKRKKANTTKRYRRNEKPIEDTFLYKMGVARTNAGVATSATFAGIGAFVGIRKNKQSGKVEFNLKEALASKGIWAGIKYTGIGAWYGMKGIGKGGAGIGKGIGHVAVLGKNGIAFKTVGKLPKMCAQYENWNRVLNHKINQIKNDTSLTRAEKEKQIKIFESQKIYLTKPAAYKNMSPEEQNAFDLEQDKLKRAAYTDKNLVKYVKNLDRMKKHKGNAGAEFAGGLTYDSTKGMNRREKHLKDYNDMNSQARRFRSTAAMRDMEKDFGDEFERFARSFLSKKRYFDMIKRYKLKNAIDYQKLTAREKEKERRKREEALAAQIARINRILAKKVAKDKKIDKKTFLAQNGYTDDLLRYKSGYYKFNQNHNPTTKLSRKEVKAHRQAAETIHVQSYAASVDKMMQEFVKFSSTYKGPSANFASELKKYAAGLGKQNEEMINKIYKKYANMFRGGLGKLENSPVAVQQKKIMESFAAELRKCQQRVTSKGKIPSTAEMNNMFVGRTFTGATTRAEVALHRQNAEELSRLVKLIRDQKNLISYDSLASRVSSTFMADFMRNNPNIGKKSEQAKKAMLESYFTQKLNEALKKAHNDNYQKSDKNQLERLNGRRVKRSEIDHSRVSPVLANAMKTADNPAYQNIVREFKSATEKVKNEQFAHDELVAALNRLKQLPRTPKNIGKTIELQKAVEQSKVKLRTLNNILTNAKKRKADYERAFASTEIKEAKASSRARAYNSSTSVMDRYTFPKKDGTVIQQGTQDAKQVQMLVTNYVQSYRQNIESMLKNEIIASNNNLRKYIDGMRSKFTADFGRNMRYTREVKAELKKYIAELEKSTKVEDVRLREELIRRIGVIDKAELTLERRMTGMNIDIANVKLRK